MKFRDGDEVIGRYLKARKRASSPRGMAVAQRGRSYGTECTNRKCKHRGKGIDQRDGQGETVKRCPQCGTPWPFSDVYALAGQSHAGKGGRPSRAVLDAGDLCLFKHRLKRAASLEPGHAQVYLWYLGDDEKTPSGRVFSGQYSHSKMADALTTDGYLGQRWHTRDVRRAIERSRAVLERDLGRRGLLSR